ncbi:scavenger receptor cysteine-rich type 1 protein M130-like [Pundamilia nyererei]|uniref:Scavenger receptor cysteine-rich type 1 protein M130-like n=1 Tax=Pundamilia nyererei TaxID=303518 RepID=A0A9Y6SQ87_9CICH|nr:PREDICTED: scavenger receptor cysteine-rich type 1 protein M130-like [Pundamilia nyererei]
MDINPLLLLMLLWSSEFMRLVGGASRCAGTLELKHLGEWRRATSGDVSIKDAADSVRLLNGTSLCSGRLEVNYNQSNQSKQSWTSVCEDHFDQQDAEVVCRELGCGPPSALQGALHGDMGAPVWSKEFQCEGHESTLLDCRSSNSTRSSCSPGKAVGLTCSEPIRLVGGASRCAGTLEIKLGEWRPVDGDNWALREAAVACKQLDCGSALAIEHRKSSDRPVWRIQHDFVKSRFSLREFVIPVNSSSTVDLTCSGNHITSSFVT